MKKILIIYVIILSARCFAQNPNLGTSGAQFLQLPVGARGAALGSAFTGISDDASSVFWNPAGITKINSTAAHFSYMRWFDMFDFNAVSVIKNFEDFGSIGLSLITFGMDKMEITTETSPQGTGRYYDAQDMAFGLTYARYLTDKFSFGVTVKYVYQRIWNETAGGPAFDVGTQYAMDFQNLTIAMSLSNFGPDLQYDGPDLNVTHDVNSGIPLNRLTEARLATDPYALPLSFQVGIGIDLFKSEFIKTRAGIDAVHPNDNKERVNSGLEVSFYDRLYLRGGYKYNYDDEDITAGAGVNIPFSSTVVRFDYAYGMYDLLPDSHRISLGVDF
jgi:hypothetical protein